MREIVPPGAAAQCSARDRAPRRGRTMFRAGAVAAVAAVAVEAPRAGLIACIDWDGRPSPTARAQQHRLQPICETASGLPPPANTTAATMPPPIKGWKASFTALYEKHIKGGTWRSIGLRASPSRKRPRDAPPAPPLHTRLSQPV
jgi:hypothetical protein